MLDFSDRTRTGISKLISRCALKSILLNGLPTDDVVTAYIGLETKLLFMLTSWNETSLPCLVTTPPLATLRLMLTVSPGRPFFLATSLLIEDNLAPDVGTLPSFLSTLSTLLTSHVVVVTLYKSHPEALRRRSQSTRPFQD